MSISKNIISLKKKIPSDINLIAVSKTRSVNEILECYNAGIKIFGENKAIELAEKHNTLPKDINWHFIGHLQTNKVKYIAPFIKLIHSIDSLKILIEINKEAKKNDRVIDCLLEFYIASEDTKFGLELSDAKQILDSPDFRQMENIRIVGVMGMASFTDNMTIVRNEFITLKKHFDVIKNEYFHNDDNFKEISMGMTNDYIIAIEEGSTMVRIGTAVFES
jgi:pyridoxal phosphate enzyme (YggS family)